MNVNELNVRKVVNASGRMSILGVSTLSSQVARAMEHGGGKYFIMDELHNEAGKFVANKLHVEAAMITNSASAAISLAVAGCISKGDEFIRRHIHDHSLAIDRNVVMMKGHHINYGAPMAEMIQLGGGHVSEVGYANGCSRADLEAEIPADAVAFMYVQSHHCVQKNMPTLEDVYQVCQERDLPLIIDAAAEEDLDQYGKYADIVIFSGSKAIEGPTTGILAGKNQYVSYARAHNQGIGRAMKVGKEAIFGLLQALQDYGKYSFSKDEQRAVLSELKQLNALSGVNVSIVQDEAGRNIFRARIQIDEQEANMSAERLVNQLKRGDVAIYTRDYNANIGYFDIDPRPLLPGDSEQIVAKITEVLGGES